MVAIFYSHGAGAHPTASSLKAQLRLSGARTVDSQITERDWTWIEHQVSDGRPDWIALMPHLARGLETGAVESFGISVALAIPKAPEAVLAIIDLEPGRPLSVDEVCNPPMIEGTVSNLKPFVLQATAAVEAVRQPALQGQRRACLAELAKARRRVLAYPTADQLRRDILANGADTVVRRMPSAEMDWVLNQMSDARPGWIALMPLIEPGTDASSGEGLGIAAAFALLKAPAAVLAIINPLSDTPLSVGRVCDAPFIEDTVKDRPAYLRRARKAVASVQQTALQDRKKACLAQLAKYRD